jgi:hypothetical protein
MNYPAAAVYPYTRPSLCGANGSAQSPPSLVVCYPPRLWVAVSKCCWRPSLRRYVSFINLIPLICLFLHFTTTHTHAASHTPKHRKHDPSGHFLCVWVLPLHYSEHKRGFNSCIFRASTPLSSSPHLYTNPEDVANLAVFLEFFSIPCAKKCGLFDRIFLCSSSFYCHSEREKLGQIALVFVFVSSPYPNTENDPFRRVCVFPALPPLQLCSCEK